MEKNEQSVLKAFWEKQAEEARDEIARGGENDHLDPYTLVEFVSTSNGKGRNRRTRAREVTLVRAASGQTYAVKTDVPHNALDMTAELAAGAEYREGLPAWEWFIKRLRNRPKRKRKK